MKIDNSENLKQFLKFESKDDYYFLSIIQRRKDNLGMRCDARGIKNYYITSLKMFEEVYSEIRDMCEFFNARAYIHINPRSWKTSINKTIFNLVERIESTDTVGSNIIFDRVSSKYQKPNLKGDRLWVVDIDSEKMSIGRVNEIVKTINSRISPEGTKVKCVNPTKSGYHIITSPFNISEFRKYYSDKSEIEVPKTESPTLLYYPDSKKDLRNSDIIQKFKNEIIKIASYGYVGCVIDPDDLRLHYTRSWKNLKFPKSFVPLIILTDQGDESYIGIDTIDNKIYKYNKFGPLKIFDNMNGLLDSIIASKLWKHHYLKSE